MSTCKAVGCNELTEHGNDFCTSCTVEMSLPTKHLEIVERENLSDKYPQYYKSVEGMSEVDVYAVHYLFNIQDSSGCIQHASKKLLLSGVRTGGKSSYKDIKEARDTLTRWLQLNQQGVS